VEFLPEGGQDGYRTGEMMTKYEEVYLRAHASVSDARSSIGRYLTFYNNRRPHSSLDRKTPDPASTNRSSQRHEAGRRPA
jgi:transposase InsO family protein